MQSSLFGNRILVIHENEDLSLFDHWEVGVLGMPRHAFSMCSHVVACKRPCIHAYVRNKLTCMRLHSRMHACMRTRVCADHTCTIRYAGQQLECVLCEACATHPPSAVCP